MKKRLESDRIDLHIHSTASDGTYTPSEIISLAQKLNLKAISITDHDTIEGSIEAARISPSPSLKLLSGVEISASPPPLFSCSGTIHILGYLVNHNDKRLNNLLFSLQEARKNRNPKIIQRLKDLGIELSLDEVRNEIGKGQLGRPHIASVMEKKGFVKSIDEAFKKYLGQGMPAYVEKYRIESSKAIKIILDAGGVPVLAHPVLIQLTNNDLLESMIENLVSMGLMGVEVYYPEHSDIQVASLLEIAKKLNLLVTGGSDFHGLLKPNVKMGSGRGNLNIPYELYEKLMDARGKRC